MGIQPGPLTGKANYVCLSGCAVIKQNLLPPVPNEGARIDCDPTGTPTAVGDIQIGVPAGVKADQVSLSGRSVVKHNLLLGGAQETARKADASLPCSIRVPSPFRR